MQIIRYLDNMGVPRHAALGAGGPFRIAGDIYGDFEVTEEAADVRRILAPVAPVDILGIGRNYRAPGGDAARPDYPVVFMKSTGSVQDPGGTIELPTALPAQDVAFEGELAVVIGTRCRNADAGTALQYVLGYTCANDLTAKDWLARAGPWWRGKSFDTFCPLGPCLVLREEIPDPSALRVRTLRNGVVTHDGPTSDMIFDVPTLIALLSADTTLLPGTVILTGTPPKLPGPAGVGPLAPGDELVVEIDPIGRLVNHVA